VGGGGVAGPDSTGDKTPDETKPSPPAAEPENPPRDDIAPEGQAQTEMVLRTIKDLLAKDAVTPDLEKATGMSRQQMEQFVKKYEAVKSPPAGPGREIAIKPGEQETGDRPAANLPGIDRQSRFSTKNAKNRGEAPKDDARKNLEGIRFTPPPEYRSKFDSYKSTLAKPRRSTSAGRSPSTGP
jgi:hypothetical protein